MMKEKALGEGRESQNDPSNHRMMRSLLLCNTLFYLIYDLFKSGPAQGKAYRVYRWSCPLALHAPFIKLTNCLRHDALKGNLNSEVRRPPPLEVLSIWYTACIGHPHYFLVSTLSLFDMQSKYMNNNKSKTGGLRDMSRITRTFLDFIFQNHPT